MEKKKSKSWLLPVIFTAVGAIGGALYAYFIGCAAGTCPITGNPLTMAIYTGILGFLLSTLFAPLKGKEDHADHHPSSGCG